MNYTAGLNKQEVKTAQFLMATCTFQNTTRSISSNLPLNSFVTKIVKGYPKREWQKTRDRNEALDCRIYARAAAIALGIDRWTDAKWDQIAEIQSENDENTVFNVKKSRKKVIKSSWI